MGGCAGPHLAAPVIRYVTIRKFSELSGYSEGAVRKKIERGEWLQGAMWLKAPDGRILVDLVSFERWAFNAEPGWQARAIANGMRQKTLT